METLSTCPSGECMDYTYDPAWFRQEPDALPPRPVSIVIHTREAFFECQHLSDLMDEPMPREVNPYDTPGAWMDSTFPNEY